MGARLAIAVFVLTACGESVGAKRCLTNADCVAPQACYAPDCVHGTAAECTRDKACHWSGACDCTWHTCASHGDDRPTCEAAGCSWSKDGCTGTPNRVYLPQVECVAQAGCTYSDAVGYCDPIPGEGTCR